MDPSSESIALGFFIGICFMATAVVALTVLYFSKPRPRNQSTTNKIDSLPRTKELATQNQRGLAKHFPLLKNFRSSPKSKAVSQSPKPSVKVEPTINRLDESEKVAEEKLQPIAEKKSDQKGISSQSNPSQSMTLPNKAGLSSGNLPVPEKSVEKENPPLITITNAPGAQVEPLPPVNSAQRVPNLAPSKNTETKDVKSEEVKPEKETVPIVASVQIVNEKQGKSEMNEKPKPENSNADFSELFTEDTEETEAGRLAKELNDVDTQDILEESRNLINQFKRNKN